MEHSWEHKYVCYLKYKGIIIYFDDSCFTYAGMIEKMASKFVRSMKAESSRKVNLGFTSFDEAIYYKIFNSSYCFLSDTEEYYNLFECKDFVNHKKIKELNEYLPSGKRIEDIKKT